MLPGATYLLQRAQLEPDDRLVLLTDGMLERNAAEARIPDLLSQISDLPPGRQCRHLPARCSRPPGGQLLDDATVLILDWYGGPDQQRTNAAGATQGRASQPTTNPG
jgi:serine phosphatase RsbU (regulator of sigma subunit)